MFIIIIIITIIIIMNSSIISVHLKEITSFIVF